MSFLPNLIMGAATELVEATGKTLDNLITNPEERIQARQAIGEAIMGRLNELASYQRDILNTELQGTKLQRNWRPLVMLSFAFIIVYHYFLQPLLGHWLDIPAIPLPDKFWGLLELGLGGYVIGRSIEKVATTVTENIELPRVTRRERRRQEHPKPQ
ncbi:hypothetical protein BH09BAC1_BH09BAC1_30850 [soil metagenome]